MIKKIMVLTVLISGLVAGQAFAKEDHEKEVKHHKQHEVKKVKTPAPTPNPAPVINNPLTGFSITNGIPGGYNTNVKLVSVMWAKGLAYSYNVYVDGVKQKTVLDSQGLMFMEYQQVMTLGTHTIGISVVDVNGNESQQCLKTVDVR
jgi:hypothetical protein